MADDPAHPVCAHRAACKRRVTAQDLAQRTLDDYTRARVHLALQLGGVPAPTGSSCSTSPPSLRYGVDALAGQTGGAGGVEGNRKVNRKVNRLFSACVQVGVHQAGAGGCIASVGSGGSCIGRMGAGGSEGGGF